MPGRSPGVAHEQGGGCAERDDGHSGGGHDLLRAVQGVAQIEQDAGVPDSSARTQLSDLIAMVREKPGMAPRVAVFLAVTAAARIRARRTVRRSDYSTWLRDESSRR